jgi:prolyl-tRNA synthetase
MTASKSRTAVSPTRAEDFAEWYQQVIRAADLAENSEVRGCMVIKPWGYGIWENIQRQLDARFKETGHRNAYFPLFIPLSYLEKEAEHVEGFAKECAVVTHYRLDLGPDGKMRPAPGAELAEPLIIRPTSETIIGSSFAKWIQSYRDLPMLINQWANVVRWEMRPRLFLRTTEFLWQEGHTVHETAEEAQAEALQMLQIYQQFARDFLALPVFAGEKTESERFPGAVNTYTIEAMVQDGKAIQAGTSHFLGQTFSRAAGIQFLSRAGTQEFGWTTSWGVSTRLIGTLIMVHSDDDGLVLPPRVAPAQVVLLPVISKPEHQATVLEAVEQLRAQISQLIYAGEPIRVDVDRRDVGGGTKNWDWIKKGIPIRLELGPRDLAQGTIAFSRRDQSEKQFKPVSEMLAALPGTLREIQDTLLTRATKFRDEHLELINSRKDFYDLFSSEQTAGPGLHGGFALAHWSGDQAIEQQIKEDLKVTIRCIPFESELPANEPGECIFSGKKSARRVIFAKAY